MPPPPEMARRIVLNAKMRRTSVCGAAETLLVDRAAAARLLPGVLDDLIEAGCEVRGDPDVMAMDTRVVRRAMPTGRPSISMRSCR